MKRKNFLKSIGLAGIGLALPTTKIEAAGTDENISGSCVLIPSETAGPYPLDLTENDFYFRQDVRETQTGVQLNLKLKIIGNGNCLPMQNVRVNIWHCSKDGLYSGYDNASNPGQAGQTYLRGYQVADVNGEVEFITVFPGWYNGRVCHIHFQVYVSTAYAAISQLTFDQEIKNSIYAANPDLYTKGIDPLTPALDGIFSDGYAYQLATLTPNADTGGYDSYLEVTVQGDGTLGIGLQEMVNAQHFILGQNYPNPYAQITTVPFTLNNESKVQIELWDLNGKRLKVMDQGILPAGAHSVELDMKKIGLPTANYIYQIAVENTAGTFREYKLMTSVK